MQNVRLLLATTVLCLLASLATLVAAASPAPHPFPALSWMVRFWQASPSPQTTFFEQWFDKGYHNYSIQSSVQQGNQLVAKVTGLVVPQPYGYFMEIESRADGTSRWKSTAVGASSITFQEVGGKGRKITLRLGSDSDTLEAAYFDAGGKQTGALTYVAGKL